MAKRTVEAFRSENGLYDLFGRKDGTVAYTRFKDVDIFGSNSNSPSYDSEDRQAANQLRDTLVAKYPDVFSVKNLGQMPNDALYHAETTNLVRTARQNGGSLAGEELEVYVDRPMCNTCPDVLPYVGLELGNPRVTFIGPKGERRTMQNGKWILDSPQ
jgi:hypothetical protein